MKQLLNKINILRKTLHDNPDPSLHEDRTRKILIDFLKKETDLDIVDNTSWFYAVYHGDDSNSIAFRAEHDAVLGQDGTVSHRCGHDGHTATLAAIALYVSSHKPKQTIYFIFQPAEEIGAGALFCLPLIQEKNIKEIFGFHNLPGYPEKTVILRKNTFACASTGLKIHFIGSVAHAAYPETGINPANTIAKLILDVDEYVKGPHKGVVQRSVIGIDCGSHAYGVNAFEGELRLTVRGEYQDEFDNLVLFIKNKTNEYCIQEGLTYTFEEIERFPSTENTPSSVLKIENICKHINTKFMYSEEPVRWSEDFGYYLQKTKGCFFGVGDGEAYPQVHTINFEYPDFITPIVLNIYKEIIENEQ